MMGIISNVLNPIRTKEIVPLCEGVMGKTFQLHIRVQRLKGENDVGRGGSALRVSRGKLELRLSAGTLFLADITVWTALVLDADVESLFGVSTKVTSFFTF
jgi:hypothetical protein